MTTEGSRSGFFVGLVAGLAYSWALLAHAAPALRAAMIVVPPVVLGVFVFG